MRNKLLHFIFCSGPVYPYVIHIFTSHLLVFGGWGGGRQILFYCSRIDFIIALYHDFDGVIQIYDLSENIWDFDWDLQITAS